MLGRALLVVALLLPTGALAQGWSLAPGSAIGFVAYQQGRPVAGGFERFSAAIELDPKDLAGSRIEVTIDVASITTGHKDRDATLRSPSFFDAARWPSARFVSQEVVHREGGRYAARGELSIRDVTREAVLPFTLAIGADPEAADRRRAQAAGELAISRLDYGVGQGEFASTGTVGEEVVIRIAIVATRPR